MLNENWKPLRCQFIKWHMEFCKCNAFDLNYAHFLTRFFARLLFSVSDSIFFFLCFRGYWSFSLALALTLSLSPSLVLSCLCSCSPFLFDSHSTRSSLVFFPQFSVYFNSKTSQRKSRASKSESVRKTDSRRYVNKPPSDKWNSNHRISNEIYFKWPVSSMK